MENTLLKKIIIVIILAVVAIGLIIASNKIKKSSDIAKEQVVMAPNNQAIKGCYKSTIAQDVYSLTITNEENGQVSGTLDYKNFEKDSSNGTFTGTYQDGMLVGDYVFMSEGMTSISEKVFKKTDKGFVQGNGEMDVEGDKAFFIDKSMLVFDESITFVPVACQ